MGAISCYEYKPLLRETSKVSYFFGGLFLEALQPQEPSKGETAEILQFSKYRGESGSRLCRKN